MRTSVDNLFHKLLVSANNSGRHARANVIRIGDCYAPGTIAAAVYSGHRCAREFGALITEDVPFRRELPQLGAWT